MSFTTRSAAVLVSQTAAAEPGGQLLSQTVAAVSASIAAVATGLLFLRTLAAVEAGVAAIYRGLYSTLAAVSIGAAVLDRAVSYLRTLAAQSILAAALTTLGNYARTLAAQSIGAAALTAALFGLLLAQALAAVSIATPAITRTATYLRTLAAQAIGLFRKPYGSGLYGAGIYQGNWMIATYLRTLPAASASATSVAGLLSFFRTLAAASASAASLVTGFILAPIRSFLSHMLTRTTDLAARFSAADQVRGRRIADTKGDDKLTDTDAGRGRTTSGTDDPSKRKPGTGGGMRR